MIVISSILDSGSEKSRLRSAVDNLFHISAFVPLCRRRPQLNAIEPNISPTQIVYKCAYAHICGPVTSDIHVCINLNNRIGLNTSYQEKSVSPSAYIFNISYFKLFIQRYQFSFMLWVYLVSSWRPPVLKTITQCLDWLLFKHDVSTTVPNQPVSYYVFTQTRKYELRMDRPFSVDIFLSDWTSHTLLYIPKNVTKNYLCYNKYQKQQRYNEYPEPGKIFSILWLVF